MKISRIVIELFSGHEIMKDGQMDNGQGNYRASAEIPQSLAGLS